MHGIYQGKRVLVEDINAAHAVIRFQDDTVKIVPLWHVELVTHSILDEIRMRNTCTLVEFNEDEWS